MYTPHTPNPGYKVDHAETLRAQVDNLKYVIKKLHEEIQDLRDQLAKQHPWSAQVPRGGPRGLGRRQR